MSKQARYGRRFALAAAGIVLAILTPIALWGVVVRSTVVEDIARREADQRLLSARLASASVGASLDEAGRRLELFATGQPLRAALRDGDERALEAGLADLTRGTAYSTALALDPAGRLLAREPALPASYGQSFADRDYYQGALAVESSYISEAVISRLTGQTVVVVARAVRDQGGVLGLLLVTLTPARLLDLIAPLNATAGREIHLIDQQARVIASTDPSQVLLSELRLQAAGEDVYTQTGSTMAHIDGEEKVVTYAPVRAARWALLVSDHPSVLLAAQRRLEQQLLVGGAATAVLALVAAVGIAWLFTLTLRQRAAIAEREEALARTNADLQQAGQHKSEFLAGMSHELRTPLNAILGFSELLADQLSRVTSERQQRYLRNIREAGEHLLVIINDVLDLSKVEAGRVELRPERLTTEALLAPVTASISEAAAARRLTFRALTAPAELWLDPGRARQILYNLLSNAVKFTPEGGLVELKVGVESRDLMLAVRDTGIGIPPEKRDRLFGTFERLHEGQSDAPGTGLGLALTKRLVDLHGGRIVVMSEPGKGTTFTVRLPDVVAEPSVRDRLLVVEDERRDADLMVALAMREGLATEVVRSVAEALAAIGRATPLAVVLDIRLPDGRGERVLEALKGQAATRDVPVVVVTVEDDDGRARALGADAHFTKPIDRARLAAWLRGVRERSHGMEASVADPAR